ncbi:hypothetical protein JANAI62_09590 [Jannaschia pagri]|uniref:Methyltransferase FkbM domain-containing protein n=1 Tax=Jannaschia pagri TaxID=2829797 RepID=A0ABQ4NJ43_9RHOB|nr:MULTISPECIES: FkbM family methyltransferase [unclassified Jannaschia]GIT89556.1 hypothetical protein JANAI61_00140 [Jannaschia sp. AI_61]GIT94336.1 hypothetical protein JANAI62_09590 [Jannaschia sp. AI_62]
MALPDKLTAKYFRKYRFDVATVIDVGVQSGTPFLYEAFPQAHFLLLDPDPTFPARISAMWGDRLRYDARVAAVSSQAGSIMMNVMDDHPNLGSVNTRLDVAEGTRAVEVDCVTLDTVTSDLAGPLGLKIDTEGHELEVLKGATETLTRCAFVIAEVSIKKRFAGGYRFSEVIAFMASQGFEVHSFLSGLTRAPRMSDVLFVPADSPRFDMIARDL